MRLRHKFRAQPTIRGGHRFDSKKEARFYDELAIRQKGGGDVLGFFMQVPLHLPGGIVYRLDFLVFYKDGSCEGIEVKGYETKEWKLKKKLVDETYPWFDLRVV